MGCRGFLQCLLKLTNFLLAMVGVAMIAYSIWMLNEWSQHNGNFTLQRNSPNTDPTHSPSFKITAASSVRKPPTSVTESETKTAMENLETVNSVLKMKGSTYGDPDIKLPAPWFIYAFAIAGVFTSLVTCTGLIGAELNSSCCLLCYSLGLAVLLTVQASLAALIYFDDTWQTDIPTDPTGQATKARTFVETHLFISRCVAIGVLVVEIFGLLLALALKAMQEGNRRGGYDSDDEFIVPKSTVTAIRQPLLPQAHGPVGPTQMEPASPQGTHRHDAWTTRMREKYGLDVADITSNVVRKHAPAAQQQIEQVGRVVEEEREVRSKGGCTVM